MTAEQLKNIIDLVGLKMDYVPKAFDLFHLGWLLITVIGVLIVLKVYDKRYISNYFTFATIVLAIGEVYKQAVLSLQSGTFEYKWANLPLQFAVVPIYTYLLSAILKRGKFYNCLCAYNGTFGLLAGTIALIMPTPVFSNFMGLNVQAMLHYSILVIVGALTLRTYVKTLTVSTFSIALAIFVFFVALSETLNAIVPIIFEQTIDLYFIGRYMQLGAPIFSHVKQAFPHYVFVIFYALIIIELTIALTYASYKLANKKKIYR